MHHPWTLNDALVVAGFILIIPTAALWGTFGYQHLYGKHKLLNYLLFAGGLLLSILILGLWLTACFMGINK